MSDTTTLTRPGVSPIAAPDPAKSVSGPRTPVALVQPGFDVAGFHVIPTTTFTSPKVGSSTASRSTLAQQTSIRDAQLQVCATNAPLRFAYGHNRLGAMLLKPVVDSSGYLCLPYVISRGVIDAVVKVQMGDADLPSLATVTNYLGNGSQPIDPTLKGAWFARGKTYADTLPGIAHGVVRLPPTKDVELGNITIEFRGAKVYDPRKDSTNGGTGSHRLADPSTWTYSANAVLCLADFITSTAYGRGETLDWASVAACADIADQVVGGFARREVHLCFDTRQKVDDVEETLAGYAGCWVVRDGNVTRLVPDAPADPVYAFTNADGSANYIADSIRITQRARQDQPTVVTVKWTDTTTVPWKEQELTELASGVDTGATPWRESVIEMPGCQSAGQARREALRRLNEAITSDLSVSLLATDPALAVLKGDCVTLTDSEGFTTKAFRVTDAHPREQGRFAVTMTEYDPASYSDAVATGPTNPDTDRDAVGAPPTVTGLTLAEERYQLQDGTWASRIRATWVIPSYGDFKDCRVRVLGDGVLINTGTTSTGDWPTPPVKELVTYTVGVAVESTFAVGAEVTASIVAQGKLLKPSDVPFFDGTEAGGEVRLRWVSAVDLDLRAHEIRYGPAGVLWEDGIVLDRVATPSLTYTTRAVPPGTWDFMIKALDSVRTDVYPNGQESVDATRKTLLVSEDPDLFISPDYYWTTPTLTNMVAMPGGGWITAIAGDTWTSRFPAAMSTYTNPVASYHSPGTSSIVTESYDFGGLRSGSFTLTPPDYDDLDGAADVYLELSSDNVSWTQYISPGGLGQGRYVRMRIETTGAMRVRSLGSVRVALTTVESRDEVTTSAAGFVTAVLDRKYAQIDTIQVSPRSQTGAVRIAVWRNPIISNDPRVLDVDIVDEDAVEEDMDPVNSFEIACLDAAGGYVAEVVKYLFKGVAA